MFGTAISAEIVLQRISFNMQQQPADTQQSNAYVRSRLAVIYFANDENQMEMQIYILNNTINVVAPSLLLSHIMPIH